MAQSKAATVQDYLDELPADRRKDIAEVLDVLRRHMPKGYRETVSSGMITYCIPLDRYPHTYNKQPLGYVALAAQKNYNALYLMAAYADAAQEKALRAGFQQAGKKLDMGKSCVRFRTAADLPLDVIGRVVGSTDPDAYIQLYEKARGQK
jgi:hypothetical protein